MVCNPVPTKVTHIPDFHAQVSCPQCRKKRLMSYFELKNSGRALDGTAEWICNACKQKTRRSESS
jgi:hypothetical protein